MKLAKDGRNANLLTASNRLKGPAKMRDIKQPPAKPGEDLIAQLVYVAVVDIGVPLVTNWAQNKALPAIHRKMILHNQKKSSEDATQPAIKAPAQEKKMLLGRWRKQSSGNGGDYIDAEVVDPNAQSTKEWRAWIFELMGQSYIDKKSAEKADSVLDQHVGEHLTADQFLGLLPRRVKKDIAEAAEEIELRRLEDVFGPDSEKQTAFEWRRWFHSEKKIDTSIRDALDDILTENNEREFSMNQLLYLLPENLQDSLMHSLSDMAAEFERRQSILMTLDQWEQWVTQQMSTGGMDEKLGKAALKTLERSEHEQLTAATLVESLPPKHREPFASLIQIGDPPPGHGGALKQ
ncbi:hypothetical protein G7Y29_07745 [Corynebacterium qintianiae]|uniref:Uncharacterized protein n=1 Tax=Corynebacterium qintianiae TaxID=2709392 RepID=A0A7T0KLL1_9CORY|nr:hypothetical protein [Corynebacterium qintianiae]QPK82762.1 hypothetical protein G7Y29_07745 [Corynebacterium qintianiae]